MNGLSKYREAIIASIILMILVIVTSFFVIFSTTFGQDDIDYQPTSGVWFCEELSLCLSFDAWNGYFIDNNGEKTICTITTAGKHSSTISIHESKDAYQTEDGIRYIAGKQLLRLEYVRLSGSLYEVEDGSGQKYTFRRIN